MAISIDWATKIITVPKADTTLNDIGPPEIRDLDLDQFRQDLNALQAGEEGIWAETTHVHNPPLTVGGVTLARTIELINGYTVTFEDGSYAVNLNGANSNVGDVVNLNTVSVRSANSAGLVVTEGGGSLTEANFHAFLDSYTNKDDWKATEVSGGGGRRSGGGAWFANRLDHLKELIEHGAEKPDLEQWLMEVSDRTEKVLKPKIPNTPATVKRQATPKPKVEAPTKTNDNPSLSRVEKAVNAVKAARRAG